MSELLQFLQQSDGLAVKIVVFFFCGLIGMTVAYSQRWARGETGISWWQYMTGDTQATASALIKLLAACWVTGGFDYLEPLSMQAIINGGILLGLSMPDKIDEDKAKHKVKDKLARKQTNPKPI